MRRNTPSNSPDATSPAITRTMLPMPGFRTISPSAQKKHCPETASPLASQLRMSRSTSARVKIVELQRDPSAR